MSIVYIGALPKSGNVVVRNKFKHARSGNLSKVAENLKQRLSPIYAWSTSNSFFYQYSLTAVVARYQAQKQLGGRGRFVGDEEHGLANGVGSAKSENLNIKAIGVAAASLGCV